MRRRLDLAAWMVFEVGKNWAEADGDTADVTGWSGKVQRLSLAAGTGEEAFYRAKLHTARFYFQRILPRTLAHKATMLSGANNLMDMKEEDFDLGY